MNINYNAYIESFESVAYCPECNSFHPLGKLNFNLKLDAETSCDLGGIQIDPDILYQNGITQRNSFFRYMCDCGAECIIIPKKFEEIYKTFHQVFPITELHCGFDGSNKIDQPYILLGMKDGLILNAYRAGVMDVHSKRVSSYEPNTVFAMFEHKDDFRDKVHELAVYIYYELPYADSITHLIVGSEKDPITGSSTNMCKIYPFKNNSHISLLTTLINGLKGFYALDAKIKELKEATKEEN